jgi:hypothetical protein
MSDRVWTTLGELTPGTLFEFDDGGERGLVVLLPLGSEPISGCVRWYSLRNGGRYHGADSCRARPLPQPGETPSPLTPGQARGLMKWAMRAVHKATQSNFLSGPEVDRIQWILTLSPGERAFVQALADAPGDGVTLKVFRDWLLDEQRDLDAGLFERGWNAKLRFLVTEFGHNRFDEGRCVNARHDEPAREAGRRAAQNVADISDLIGWEGNPS